MTQALTTDLSTLFTDAPVRPSMEVRYRAGVIKAWNPATLENIITVDGVDLVDLPVLGLAEADSYAVGTVVGLHLISSKNGSASWAIVGAFVKPGTAAATEALSRLSSRIRSVNVADFANTGSTSYTDLSPAGPTVPNFLIGASGSCLVIVSCRITVSTNFGDAISSGGGYMSYEVSGPTNRSASDQWAAEAFLRYDDLDENIAVDGEFSFSRVSLQTGLTPGTYSVTAKYRKITGTTPNPIYSERNVTIFSL